MTYNQEDENAIHDAPLPSWAKAMKTLVFSLLIVSILAMCALIYAALTIVKTKSEVDFNISIPAGAELISVTTTADGHTFTLYNLDGYVVALRDSEGVLVSETKLK